MFDITTQEQLVALGANHYTSVQSLRISGSVNDLSPLKDLAFVTGGMEIINTNLKDFSGLEHLEMVGSIFPNSLRLEGNRMLLSLKGLNKLKMVRGYFSVLRNPLLTDLKGLDSYTTTSAGEFRVDNCAALRSLDGIENMLYCNDGITIVNNPLLKDLTALRNLKGTTSILIGTNNSLSNLNGLEGLTQVGIGNSVFGSITLQDNPLLNNLEGLRNISKCENLFLSGNQSLKSLNGLNAISVLNYATIENNVALVDLKGLSGLKTVTSILKISANNLLQNMDGLQQLEKVGRLELIQNKGIKDLSGLDGLKSVNGPNGYAITIGHNENLLSLHGLEQLNSSTEGIQILYNKNLGDFCALKLLMKSYKGYFLTLDNKIVMDEKILQNTCK
ncbi:MAG: leucine-rich repeat domain-containing protein [Chryseobacterium sp.]|nr:MAG: leucine-rich repeat domain-containing protein [Chryseobacterium sp.]